MPTTCKIEIENNPAKIIYAGQLLKGTVELDFTVRKIVRSVYVRVLGLARVYWKEARKPCQGNEEYLNDVTFFVGGSNDGEIELPPGTYKYKFQCFLRHDLPSSVEGDCGYIRYVTKVVFDMPLWADKKFEETFTVIRPINLNEIPLMREPVIVELEERIYPYYFMCYESKPVKITARMAVGGYCPGESIILEISVKNISNQPFPRFTAELIRHLTFFLETNSKKQREETITLVEETTEGCDANQNKIIRMNIEVPQTPPTEISSSNIVKVRYFIHLIAETPTFYSEPNIDIPITIGSNPHQNDIKPARLGLIPNIPNTPVGSPADPPSDVVLKQPFLAKNTLEPKY